MWGRFMEKNYKKGFRAEKVTNRKGNKYVLIGKTTIVLLMVRLIKKTLQKQLKSSKGRVEVELDLSNYATKADLKNAAGADTSKFAKKDDLASLKSDVDELDINKLKNIPTNLRNLKSKVEKLDFDKLVLVLVDLNK